MSDTTAGLVQLGALVLLLAAVYVPFGNYLAHVFSDDGHWRVERMVYRLVRVDPDSEQRWTGYAAALLAFEFVSVVFLYLLQRLQAVLPLSLGRGAIDPGIAFNNAISFATNTDWQSYVPESVMGHLVQMAGLTVQNFASAAVGMAVAVALVRGFARASTDRIGNFWVDLVRGTSRVLLPISFVVAILFVALGVTMSLHAGVDVTGVDGGSSTIALAPTASQEAIKEFGTNGGGIYNANSAHPFENPTALTDLLQVFLLLVLPVCLTRAFGVMVRNTRQGSALLAVMGVLWGVMLAVGWLAETHPNGPASLAAGAALEGKEVRFGVPSSVLFAVSTTGTSTGAVNSMHDSYTGLGGGVTLLHILFGEVSPGGVGTGLYGILVIAVVAVFLAGLMVGRTPEYLGKKLGRTEVTAAAISILSMPTVVLLGAAAALAQPGLLGSALNNDGAHGLSEVLYAYSSAGNNNGSAFAGITVTSPFFQTTLAVAMLVGRFVPILASLALAGSLVTQKRVEPGAGTLPTTGALFGVMVAGTVVLVAALTFFPALALGPIAEALMMTTPTLDRPTTDDPRPRTGRAVGAGAFFPGQLWRSLPGALRKFDPRTQVRNPVMFVVWVGSVLVTVSAVVDPGVFAWLIAIWLWLTVLFANLAEAVAEGRGKAQADSLRRTRTDTVARRLGADGAEEEVPGTTLRVGDRVVVEAGQVIPGDGDIVEGIASVDESAITGESAPVIREAGGDRSSVTGGTTVLSDRIVVQITAAPGESFVDRMIALVEGAQRQKTPNEIALTILLAALTIIFLLAVVALQPMAGYSGQQQSLVVLTALLVCLIPTTIGALLSAIGIAGMDRLVQRNVLATSGRAVEAAGDVDTLLLDKTGTITFGNRRATALHPAPGVEAAELAAAARLSSLADQTPEGRSIVELCAAEHGLPAEATRDEAAAEFVPFTAQTRMSGLDLADREVRKGAGASVAGWLGGDGVPPEVAATVDRISGNGGTPLVVAERTGGTSRALGAVELSDVVKPGMVERFSEMRAMGIRTVMVTGDNPLTAKAIAAQAGVDDYLAEATPEDKIALIRKEQEGGRLVAMTGDGTNDAPALAQADVGVAMNTGTAAAKEAGNMVDLDSNPTKLIEVVEIGKQLLITRGALTTFSVANDVAKYFAIVPAMFAAVYPSLGALNVMHLATPQSAILSAVVFNALVIVALIPLALRGVRYRPTGAAQLLRRNLLIYGLGGIVVPFLGIFLIDLVVRLIPGI